MLVTVGRAAAEQREAILNRLNAFNLAHAGPTDAEALCISVAEPGGTISGGLYGTMAYDWLIIELLFVPEDLRRQKVGTQLISQAEDHARAKGCIGAWLDTFSFQARGFYEKLGYQLVGTIPDHPRGEQRHFLMKRWA